VVSGVKARQLPNYACHFRELGFQEVYSRSFYGGMVQAKVFLREIAPHAHKYYI
jgi:hypothetical protein